MSPVKSCRSLHQQADSLGYASVTTYDLADVALGYRKLEANIISVHGFRDGYAVGIVNDSACNIRESLFSDLLPLC